jgi:hypothetical protein
MPSETDPFEDWLTQGRRRVIVIPDAAPPDDPERPDSPANDSGRGVR